MDNSKTFVTSDGAKHTRFSSDDEETPKEEQKSAEKEENIEVHSANAWEKADLGDGQRNNKFLRLMGAGKKAHKGRFVIGDNSPHQKEAGPNGKSLNDKLEQQFKQSMEHRLTGGKGGHIGLGFHEDSEAKKPADEDGSRSSADAKPQEKVGDDKEDSSATEKKYDDKDRKRSAESKPEDKASDVKKLKFVKSSSND